MFGRTNTEGYAQAVSMLRNMYCDSRGPARSRPGMRFINRFYEQEPQRIIALDSRFNSSYFIKLTNLKLEVIDLSGAVVPPASELISNSNFEQGGDYWAVSSSGAGTTTFIDGSCILTPTEHANQTRWQAISQQVTTTSVGVEHELTVMVDHYNIYDIYIGTTDGATDIAYEQAPTSQAFKFTPNVASFWIRIQVVNQNLTYPPGDVIVLEMTCRDPAGAGETSFVTPWPTSELRRIHTIHLIGSNDYYLLHPNHQPYKLDYDGMGGWTFIPVTFTGKPASWDGNNWPATGVVHQGRLFLGGTPFQPETFWASQSGSYTDFTEGTQDDDGFNRTIQFPGRIVWMAVTKDLVIGTSQAELLVTSDGPILTPSDVQVKKQSGYGSTFIQPVIVGDALVYVSGDRRKLRVIQYEWTSNNWQSEDISFASEHITEGHISEIAWAQNPNNIIWIVTNDAKYIGVTYERDKRIFGWHRHDTDGKVWSVAVTTLPSGTSLPCFMTTRQDDTCDFEHMDLYWVRTDSWAYRYYTKPQKTIDGLEHLEGRTVQIWTRGGVHPDQVVTNGSVSLQWESQDSIVGLQFDSQLYTLPMEFMADNQTSLGMLKQWVKIYVYIYDSLLPKINGRRPPERSAVTPMDTIPQSMTGARRVSELGITGTSMGTAEHVHNNGQIMVHQDLPVMLQVLAIYGELSLDSL